MAKFLNVFLHEELVGRLEQDDSGALWFSYEPSWVESGRPTLSASLPLRAERFDRNHSRPFFAGLLPEEDSRKLLAKGFGISDRNDFALLEKIGAECAGAVSLLPLGEKPVARDPRYREVGLSELAEKLAQLPTHPLLAGEEGIRLSLAGAQSKLAVAIFEGRISLPLDGSPSSHIVKPQSPHFEKLVENEFFCMRLAKRVGLDVANVEIGTAGSTNFLQIERFDRNLADGKLQRIHQEDFCQALGIPPELKYQQEGGPNLKKCFELVRNVSNVPGPDILRLFDAVNFNFLIGNSDAHGKNFSFIYATGGAKLAPLYDLVCTQSYSKISAGLAMKIGDERRPDQVIARNWRKFFKDAGIGPTPAIRRLLDLAERVEEASAAMKEESGAPSVLPIVKERCRQVREEEWSAV